MNEHIRAAVQYARDGEFKKSLAIFDRLATDFHGNYELFKDYLVVLAWSGDCKKANYIFEKKLEKKVPLLPNYVLREVGKCYRNLKKPARSIQAYKPAVSSDSKDMEALIGLAYAYSENKEAKKALNLLKTGISTYPGNSKLKFALAYIYERNGDDLHAVMLYDSLLKPKKERATLIAKIRALSRLGADTLALEMIGEAGVTDTSLIEYVKGNFAARLINWSRKIPPEKNKKSMWNDLNRAIKVLNEQLDANQKNRRARYDLMGARILLAQPKGILKTYKRLREEKRSIPNWVLEIVADAYMETEAADPAISIYKTLLKSNEKHYYWLEKLYSAYLLKNDLTRASEVLEKLLKMESSPTLSIDGLKTTNWKKVEVEIDSAWLSAYKDRLYESQKRFNLLLSKAPHNSSIHSGMAHILLWRGLPERAEKEFQWILNYDPTYTSVITGYTETLMTLMKYREAETEIKKLSSVYPVTRNIEKSIGRWMAIKRAGIAADSTFVQEERGGKDWGADVRLHSQLIRYNYRFNLNYSKRRSTADSGSEGYERAGAGIIYNRERLFILTERLSYDPRKNADFRSFTSVKVTPDDHFSFQGVYDSFLLDLPLRARIGGIDGKSYSMSVTFSPYEGTSMSANTSLSRYSDDNSRKNFSLTYRQKVIPGFRYRAFLTLNATIGTNSLKGTDYFNPSKEVGYDISLFNEFTMVNIFRKRFVQGLTLSLGQYRQSGFSSAMTAGIRYEHIWKISSGKEFVYGVHWDRRVYDGKSEQTPGIYGNLKYNF